MTLEFSEPEREKLAKLDKIRAAGIDPYPARAQFVSQRVMAAQAVKMARQTAVQTTQSTDEPKQSSIVNEPALSPPKGQSSISVMGRIIGKRGSGKISFANIEDGSGKIQLFVRVGEDSLAADNFARWMDVVDPGDFVEALGEPIVTKTGEPSLRVTAWNLLSKAITPLPLAKEEKQPDGTVKRYGAMTDPEVRYRARYADLAVNPEVRDIFKLRARIITAMREFFDQNDFLEVETPILQPIYGGAAARPFVTHHNQLDQDLFLRISFELYLKRLVVGNLERVYEIGRDFRNEGVSFKHNPEFTMLEFYAAYMDMYSVMDFTERMLQHIARRVLPPEANGQTQFRGQTINWLTPFARIKLRDIILQKTGVDYKLYPDVETLADEVVRRKLLPPDAVKGKPWGKILDGLIGDYVEKDLVQPTFLYEYPRDISPFAKGMPDDPMQVERFEGFIGGAELCNAFSELNDPIDQYNRFVAEGVNAVEGEGNPVDEDYVRALMYGMPTCGGFGMGIDRLVMMFTNKDTIREVLLFPHLRKV